MAYNNNNSNQQENEEIEIFREYLRINTAQPDPNYEPAVEFLRRQSDRINLPINVYYPADPKRPIVIITWPGTDPKLSSIVLNSHMDTVSADAEQWSHPPFEANIDGDGRIYARGTQDTKSIGVQYLAAIRALKADGLENRRTIYVIFTPDEEIGGLLGMKAFLGTKEFRALNVGFSLDEGNASPTDVLPVFYGERPIWRAKFRISGTAGHGSLLLVNTAGEKCHRVLGKYLLFRDRESQKLIDHPNMTVGDVTTVNLTVASAGDKGNANVVPAVFTVTFDIRLAVDMTVEAMDEEINSWAMAGGDGIDITFPTRANKIKPSPIDNIYANAVIKALTEDLLYKYELRIRPGATDSRYLREIGIPSFGFSPMPETPVLLHSVDEFLKVSTYLQGIEIYRKIIKRLANA